MYRVEGNNGPLLQCFIKITSSPGLFADGREAPKLGPVPDVFFVELRAKSFP